MLHYVNALKMILVFGFLLLSDSPFVHYCSACANAKKLHLLKCNYRNLIIDTKLLFLYRWFRLLCLIRYLFQICIITINNHQRILHIILMRSKAPRCTSASLSLCISESRIWFICSSSSSSSSQHLQCTNKWECDAILFAVNYKIR